MSSNRFEFATLRGENRRLQDELEEERACLLVAESYIPADDILEYNVEAKKAYMALRNERREKAKLDPNHGSAWR